MNRDLHIIGFQVGRETYGVPITSLHEIVRVPEITPVPDAPAYMEGVINLRGKIVTVIDLRKRLGQKQVAPSKRNRILVVEHNGKLCGLMVDSASEVLKVPHADVQPSRPQSSRRADKIASTASAAFRGALSCCWIWIGFSTSAAPSLASRLTRRGKSSSTQLQTSDPRSLVGGRIRTEFMSTPGVAIRLGSSELKMLQTLVYQECGMYFDERRMDFLQNRLQGRLRECQAESFYSYYRLLVSPGGRQELARLLEDLTVNETSFFRNLPQLELFHKNVLTDILREKQRLGNTTIRIWSAGCSTGQEPYTLAMLVADGLSYLQGLRHPFTVSGTHPRPLIPPPWTVEILASDINYTVLRAGQEGIYAEHQMVPVDYSYRLRYFDKVGERYAIKQSVKELVHFDFHNLKTQFLPQDNDVIFCRNVMMYFDQAEQKRLVEKFRRCLNPGGYIFLGHAETLRGLSEEFALLQRNHGTAYQRIEEGQ